MKYNINYRLFLNGNCVANYEWVACFSGASAHETDTIVYYINSKTSKEDTKRYLDFLYRIPEFKKLLVGKRKEIVHKDTLFIDLTKHSQLQVATLLNLIRPLEEDVNLISSVIPYAYSKFKVTPLLAFLHLAKMAKIYHWLCYLPKKKINFKDSSWNENPRTRINMKGLHNLFGTYDENNERLSTKEILDE